MVLLLVFDTETSIVYVTYFYIRTKFYFDYLKSILGGTFITIINDITQIMLFFTVRSHIISHQISFYLFLRRLKFFWMFFLLVCVSPCLDNVELCTLKKTYLLYFSTRKYKEMVNFHYNLDSSFLLPSIVYNDCIEKLN